MASLTPTAGSEARRECRPPSFEARVDGTTSELVGIHSFGPPGVSSTDSSARYSPTRAIMTRPPARRPSLMFTGLTLANVLGQAAGSRSTF